MHCPGNVAQATADISVGKKVCVGNLDISATAVEGDTLLIQVIISAQSNGIL